MAWYEKAYRWNQCNLTEIDAEDCDIDFWRRYWRKNHITGTIVNCGGTVAYYPSDNPYQYRAKYLNGRDLTGEYIRAAHEEGLVVMARMDINQATRELYEEKPEWFARDINGNPQMMGERYLTCVNSGYYKEQIPKVMAEVIHRFHPEALGDNSWTGAGTRICYCHTCKDLFRNYSGMELPVAKDYSDPAYRLWLQWSIALRTEIFRDFNELTTREGGPDCVWMGMIHADFYPSGGAGRLYDYAELRKYGKAQMIDSQGRDFDSGFEQNTVNGSAAHEVFGDDTLIIQSMAQYHFGKYFMRRTANAPKEAQSWMLAGITSGLAPSPHYIGSKQDDQRMFDICTPVLDWQKKNEDYLYHRTNAANVALVWSTKNYFYYGQDQATDIVKRPYMGMVYACRKGRIGYAPVNASQITEKKDRFDVLVLPEVAVLSDDEIAQVTDFIKDGGSIVMTGTTGILDELGYLRKSFPIDELLGITRSAEDLSSFSMGTAVYGGSQEKSGLDQFQMHNYLRFTENRGFLADNLDGTDIVALHAQYSKVRSSQLEAAAYMVPSFPLYPPEFAYMDKGKRVSDDPAVLYGDTGFGGRVVYIAADIDRRYGEVRDSDLGTLLVNALRYALDGREPFRVEGPGQLDCKIYRQEGRHIFHILNHSGAVEFPSYTEELYPVGPINIEFRLKNQPVSRIYSCVSETEIPYTEEDGVIRLTLPMVGDMEMLLIE